MEVKKGTLSLQRWCARIWPRVGYTRVISMTQYMLFCQGAKETTKCKNHTATGLHEITNACPT